MSAEIESTTVDVNVERLRAARRAKGMTQEAAAAALGVARTTFVAIEKGSRRVQPAELLQLARLYEKQVGELLREAPMPENTFAQFRLRPGLDDTVAGELSAAIELLQGLADDYAELERLTRSPLPQRYPPQADISALPPASAGESLATVERNRLGLGDAPVLQLRQLLESDVGLRIFSMKLPSSVAGLFVSSSQYGACIAINIDHPAERQRWSLAHEYAHFIAQRSRTEITQLHAYARVPAPEKFAETFAENFLMPSTGLKRRFDEIRQSRPGGITPADLLQLAALFQVSLEALVRRLETLGLLRPHTWDRLLKAGFRVGEAREMLELAAAEPDRDTLPLRFRYLAVEAHLNGELSEGQLARMLRVDRQQARRLVQDLSRRIGLDERGTARELDLAAAYFPAIAKALNP